MVLLIVKSVSSELVLISDEFCPSNIRWISIVQADFPFVNWEADVSAARVVRSATGGVNDFAPIDVGTSVGGILQNFPYRTSTRFLPDGGMRGRTTPWSHGQGQPCTAQVAHHP